jgi:hypothetical protein
MNRCSHRRLGLVLFGILAMSSIARAQTLAPTTTPPPSTVPRSVPFTGQVATPEGDARTGSVMLTFGLYADQKDGTPIWTEQHLIALGNDGRYSVILGSTSVDGLPADAFAAGTPRWLGVQVEGDAEQPRFMLLSVPYALKAGDADTVGGRPVTEFVTSLHLTDSVKSAMKESKTDPSAPFVTPNALVKYQNSGGALTESSTVDVGGRLGVQVAAPISELDVAGFGSSTTITLRNGGSAADVVKLVGADGSLRIGSATTANLINLIGPWVGIGTTTPNAPLHVRGADAASTTFTVENVSGQASRQLYLSTYGSAGAGAYWPGLDSANTSSLFGPNLLVVRAANGLAFSGSSTAEHMRIAPNGNVGIGTTTPAQKLTVQASGYGLTQTNGTVTVGSYVGLNGGWYGTKSNHPLYFFANDSFPVMTITPSGSVGIGTTTPFAQLQVNSDTAAIRAYADFGAVLSAVCLTANQECHGIDGTVAEGNNFSGYFSGGSGVHVFGNLTVTGSKTGYVVDVMQNADASALELGDLVVIVGSSAPVLGQIPVPTVKKASAAYDTGVAGVIDQALYVPDAATKAAYDTWRAAERTGQGRLDNAGSNRPPVAPGASGDVYATDDVSVGTGGYANVVTLGSFKMVKVDASFGAIRAGDLLTTSANPGHAMKVTDKLAAMGAVIGKALADFEIGSGTIPVLVTLK